jgi:pimeloyl-ACP methyl ester carboxylesterase
MPCAHLGDVQLAWEERGARDAPVLLLVHGFTGHRDDFREVSADLSRSRRVIAPDLRGHGDSGPAPDAAGYSFDCLVEDLVRLLDHVECERVDLLGHSFGGMVALRFALAAPQRLRTLTLMSTSPGRPDGMDPEGIERAIAIALDEGMESLQARAERAARRHPDPIVERWGDRYWPHHRRRYRAMDAQAYAGLGRTMVRQQPVTARLGEIACPTLVLVGGHDAQFLPGADLLETHIPGARRITFDDAGHHPHQESREAFLEAMAAHLGAV